MTQEQYINELKEQWTHHIGMQREYEKLASEHSRKARKLDIEVYQLETGITEGAIVSVWADQPVYNPDTGYHERKTVCKYYMKVQGMSRRRAGHMEITGYQLNANGKPGKRFKTSESWQTVKLEKKAKKVG